MTIDELPTLPPTDLAEQLDERVWERLREQYRGVFDLPMLRRHVADHLGPDVATEHVALVRERCPSARSVLDVGSGFGSFVAAASAADLGAVGVELAAVELAHAARRRPGAFATADATGLPFPDEAFDVVTLWNVLEHVADAPAVLAEAARVLRAGGSLFVEAPNYDAFRREAHYHVPWAPFLRGRLATGWLRLLGRDPRFWSEDVRPCGKGAVIGALRRLGLDVSGVAGFRLDPTNPPHSGRKRAIVLAAARLRLLPVLRLVVELSERNPLQGSIRLVASKP